MPTCKNKSLNWLLISPLLVGLACAPQSHQKSPEETPISLPGVKNIGTEKDPSLVAVQLDALPREVLSLAIFLGTSPESNGDAALLADSLKLAAPPSLRRAISVREGTVGFTVELAKGIGAVQLQEWLSLWLKRPDPAALLSADTKADNRISASTSSEDAAASTSSENITTGSIAEETAISPSTISAVERCNLSAPALPYPRDPAQLKQRIDRLWSRLGRRHISFSALGSQTYLTQLKIAMAELKAMPLGEALPAVAWSPELQAEKSPSPQLNASWWFSAEHEAVRFRQFLSHDPASGEALSDRLAVMPDAWLLRSLRIIPRPDGACVTLALHSESPSPPPQSIFAVSQLLEELAKRSRAQLNLSKEKSASSTSKTAAKTKTFAAAKKEEEDFSHSIDFANPMQGAAELAWRSLPKFSPSAEAIDESGSYLWLGSNLPSQSAWREQLLVGEAKLKGVTINQAKESGLNRYYVLVSSACPAQNSDDHGATAWWLSSLGLYDHQNYQHYLGTAAQGFFFSISIDQKNETQASLAAQIGARLGHIVHQRPSFSQINSSRESLLKQAGSPPHPLWQELIPKLSDNHSCALLPMGTWQELAALDYSAYETARADFLSQPLQLSLIGPEILPESSLKSAISTALVGTRLRDHQQCHRGPDTAIKSGHFEVISKDPRAPHQVVAFGWKARNAQQSQALKQLAALLRARGGWLEQAGLAERFESAIELSVLGEGERSALLIASSVNTEQLNDYLEALESFWSTLPSRIQSYRAWDRLEKQLMSHESSRRMAVDERLLDLALKRPLEPLGNALIPTLLSLFDNELSWKQAVISEVRQPEVSQ